MTPAWEGLNTVWFALIAILWIGYFFLEGFDFGVGTLLPFISRSDDDRRVVIRSIGPFWDGNEVWLLTAGGATFAAFPQWYATLFSGFYLPLLLILLALIVRGVAFEFRHQRRSEQWKKWWDVCIFVGSALPALLWGVAFADMLKGVPINAQHEYTGNFFNLLQPYALLGGLMTLLLFTMHGSIFLSIRTKGDIAERARAIAWRLSWPVAAVVLAFLAWTYVNATAVHDTGVVPSFVPFAALAAIVSAGILVRARQMGSAFALTGLTIALTFLTIFLNLYPHVLVSSTNRAFSLNVLNAASSNYTLTVMTVVALVFTPIVLLYQGWTYWVFRQRVGSDDFALPAVLQKKPGATGFNGH